MTKIGLRERKAARLKVGLAETLLELLEQRPLEDISIRELCEAHEISEATFFNYYPRKQDVLSYFMGLWRLEMTWMAERASGELDGLAVIEALFEQLAEQWAQFPAFMGEMLAHQARYREAYAEPSVTAAECLQAFSELEGIEQLQAESLDGLFSTQLGRALEAGQLPADSDRETLVVALMAISAGVPMQMRQYEPERIGEMYQKELQLLWRGAAQ